METDFSRYKPALERQVQSWFWLNDRMRPWIDSLDKLVQVNGSDININLHGLKGLYTDRFFREQLDEVCPKMIETLIKPGLRLFVQSIGYRSQSFSVNIRIGAEKYNKVFTVKNPDWE